ncbi:MBL fold metallo-hydrolase [soil metagenome]
MILFFVIILIIALIVFFFVRQPKFGKLPSGERLKTIKNSPNYKNGTFQNLSNTPALTEGTSYYKVLKEFIFSDKSNAKPKQQIPSVKTDLLHLDISQDILVWFGHSSYFMQVDGKRILVDPVLSGSASPLPNGTKAFAGSDIYSTDDIPAIDFLFITHDHWDHLDYKTVVKLREKTGIVICGLGTAAHLEYWGYDTKRIMEKDWNESFEIDNGFNAHTVTARHFSGRSFWRNKSIWTSFVLQTPNYKIFIGGDSGYDTHFAETGKKFGPFDLAILENGQYDKSWKYIHMMPEEVLLAAKELGAKKLLPVHSSKFALANHDWNAPLKTLTSFNQERKVDLVTPMIGEAVNLQDNGQVFKAWWEEVK